MIKQNCKNCAGNYIYKFFIYYSPHVCKDLIKGPACYFMVTESREFKAEQEYNMKREWLEIHGNDTVIHLFISSFSSSSFILSVDHHNTWLWILQAGKLDILLLLSLHDHIRTGISHCSRDDIINNLIKKKKIIDFRVKYNWKSFFIWIVNILCYL